MKWLNLGLTVLLLLLLRKLLWCLRWLWCYYHGKEVPAPISFLPQQTGRIFEHHIQEREEENDPHEPN